MASSIRAAGTSDGNVRNGSNLARLDRSGNSPFTSMLFAQYHWPMVVKQPCGGTRARAVERRVHQGEERFPFQAVVGQQAVGSVVVEADGPELVVKGLAHLHAGHPERDFAGVEVAEQPPLKAQQERRMDRIAQVEQRVRTGEAVFQLGLAQPVGFASSARSCASLGRVLVEQAVVFLQAVLREALAERADAGAVLRGVLAGGQQFQPDEVQRPVSCSAQRPLQRHGKIAAAEPVFGRETAAEKNGACATLVHEMEPSKSAVGFAGKPGRA